MDKKRFVALGLVVTLGVTASACGKKDETETVEEKVAVEVQKPSMGNLSTDTAYIGMVSPQDQVYVVPMVSGTVTETFFEVGDVVVEGDVLFKIDDEAYQLQMKNAQAAYNAAQAGVTAQSGGARDLQNYQTEQQIQQLKDSLNDTYENKDDMEDTLDELRDAQGQLTKARDKAQKQVDAITKQLGVKEEELKAAKDAYDKMVENNPNPATYDQDVVSNYQQAQQAVAMLESQLALAKTGLNTAQSQLSSIQSSKTQVKSGIDQIESSQDTLRDNIATAEGAYSITQQEIYPETDAASAAQLQQAAVGIDSAKMQLDHCTVTAPIGGVIESFSVEKNGMAAQGNPACIISNKESMTVTFSVAEQAKNALKAGDHVTVERNGAEHEGVITEIGTMANQQTKLFQVKASVSGAADDLPNGVNVKVYATTEREENKLIIPYDSIYFSAGDAYVYCVENGRIVKTDVTVGLMSDTEAVIEEGLTADSQVVKNWSSKLRNGVEVELISDKTTDEPDVEEEE